MADGRIFHTADGKPARPLTRDLLRRVLRELDTKLADRPHTELMVVGGAAVMATVPTRSSFDVDVAAPALDGRVAALARVIGLRHQLRADWLNDAFHRISQAQGGPDIPLNGPLLFGGQHLSVYAAQPEQLMWLKVQAGRDIDFDDIVDLMLVEAPHKTADEWIADIAAVGGELLTDDDMTFISDAAKKAHDRAAAQNKPPSDVDSSD